MITDNTSPKIKQGKNGAKIYQSKHVCSIYKTNHGDEQNNLRQVFATLDNADLSNYNTINLVHTEPTKYQLSTKTGPLLRDSSGKLFCGVSFSRSFPSPFRAFSRLRGVERKFMGGHRNLFNSTFFLVLHLQHNIIYLYYVEARCETSQDQSDPSTGQWARITARRLP